MKPVRLAVAVVFLVIAQASLARQAAAQAAAGQAVGRKVYRLEVVKWKSQIPGAGPMEGKGDNTPSPVRLAWELTGTNQGKAAIIIPPEVRVAAKKDLGYDGEIPFAASRSGNAFDLDVTAFVKKVNDEVRAEAEKRKREAPQPNLLAPLFGFGGASEPAAPPTVGLAIKIAPEDPNLRVFLQGTLTSGTDTVRLELELLGKPEASPLVIEYFAGQGQPAQRLAAGEPFRVPLSAARETMVVFRISVVDADGKPMDSDSIHYRVRLGGRLAGFASADRDGARSSQTEQEFDQTGGDVQNPILVKWVFPSAAGGEFARTLRQAPAGNEDLTLDVEVRYRPKAAPPGRPPA